MSAPIDGTYAPVSSMDALDNRHAALEPWSDSRRVEHRFEHPENGQPLVRASRAVAPVAVAILSQMDQALLMIDRRHSICFCNETAQQLLAKNSAVQIIDNRFAFAAKEMQRGFEQMIEALPWRNTEDVGENRVFRIGDDEHALIVVSRVIDAGNHPDERTGLLILHRATEPKIPHVPGLLRQAFGLTRAEAVVATMIAGGNTPAEIASHRNVSVETIRAQLRVLYSKTATNRQAELVRLVHRVTYLT